MLSTVNFRSDHLNFTNMNLGLIAYWLAIFLYQGNPDRNRKLWNIVSSERYIYFICRCCCRKGRTIRSRISYLYATAFNVPWTILSWVRTSWQIPAHTTFASTMVRFVHTLVRKIFPTPSVHTFIAKAKWKQEFITKKDVLPGVKPPTTACASPDYSRGHMPLFKDWSNHRIPSPEFRFK
jgi:hypothetical protein